MKEKRKKGYVSIRKRCLSAMLALIMVLGLASTTGMQAYAAEAPGGYTTDENGLVAYLDLSSSWYDIKGYVNGRWEDTTYYNEGFIAKIYGGSDELKLTSTPTFIMDGKAIQVEYTVTNTGTATVSNYQFWVGADTQLAGEYSSTNRVKDSVLTMISGKIGFFAYATGEDATIVSTEYGYFNKIKNQGKAPTSAQFVDEPSDSAFVMYFPSDTLEGDASKTYTVVYGVCDKAELSKILNDPSLAVIEADYANEEISGLTPGADYEITVDGDSTIYKFTASENGAIPVAGSDINGTSYDFMGKTISIVKKGDQTTSDSEPTTLDIAARPTIPDSVETIEKGAITRTENQITVNAKDGYEYSVDGVTWFKDDDGDGKIAFSGLDDYKAYNIYYRYAATESGFASTANTMHIDPLYSYEADYANEEISGLTPGADYEITIDGDSIIYKFTASENGTIPVTGSDINGTSYDFTGKTISIVKKGGQTTSDSKPATLDIAARPSIPDSVETIETGAVTRTENQITVNAKDGYEYSFDGVTWFKDDDGDGKIAFSGLDNCKEYNIYYRYAATESGFASASNTMNVKSLYDYSEKILIATENQSGNFAAGGLKNTANELRDAVLTEADKIAIGAGKNFAVWIDMKDATSTVSDSDKTLVTENLPTNYVVGKYLDINFLKQISEEDAVKVTQTPGGTVKIGFTIPAELQKSGRIYKIIRIHDGVATVLDATVDGDYELTFETDRFSTYALVYTDGTTNTTTPATTDGTTTNSTTTSAASPKTGDTTNMALYLAMFMIGATGLAVVAFRRKRQ